MFQSRVVVIVVVVIVVVVVVVVVVAGFGIRDQGNQGDLFFRVEGVDAKQRSAICIFIYIHYSIFESQIGIELESSINE